MRLDAIARFFPFVSISLAVACGGSPTPPSPPAPPGLDPVASSSASSAPAASSAPLASASATAPASPPKPAQWAYAELDHWSDLDSTFSACKAGKQQSPIALPGNFKADALAIARPAYAPIPLAIFDNGHTVQVKNTVANSITIDSVKYDLAQFHFHSPAEHTVGGKKFDLEMHFVHKSADGKFAVVGLLFTKGRKNELLETIWNSIPKTESDTPTLVPNVTVDVSTLFPKDPKFAHYDGSLTVPPCTEGVSWFVVEPPAKGGLEVSADQIARYQAVFHGPTNRPVQPLNGRTIVEVKAH